MKMLSPTKENRKHSVNLTEKLMDESIIGFGIKERKVEKSTRKQVFLKRNFAKSTLDQEPEEPIL
jgi:hypothetical protein